jgi:hypothetical protein
LDFKFISKQPEKWSDKLDIVDSEGISICKSSNTYDIYTYRIQYNTSTTFDVSIRTAKDCYSSSENYRYFSTNGFGNPTDSTNWDLALSFYSGESSMPQFEMTGVSLKEDKYNITSFWDVTSTGLTLSLRTAENTVEQVTFASAYIYEDNGKLYIVYKSV